MPTDSLRDAAFCDVLNRELVCALGCTEPIAVAYAAALASQTLGCEPDHMDVACSGNIIKNVKSVTVPNSGGMHGIEAAAVLGAVGGDAKSALEVLERWKLPVSVSRRMESETGRPPACTCASKSKYCAMVSSSSSW